MEVPPENYFSYEDFVTAEFHDEDQMMILTHSVGDEDLVREKIFKVTSGYGGTKKMISGINLIERGGRTRNLAAFINPISGN